jgi:hypothetical protein
MNFCILRVGLVCWGIFNQPITPLIIDPYTLSYIWHYNFSRHAKYNKVLAVLAPFPAAMWWEPNSFVARSMYLWWSAWDVVEEEVAPGARGVCLRLALLHLWDQRDGAAGGHLWMAAGAARLMRSRRGSRAAGSVGSVAWREDGLDHWLYIDSRSGGTTLHIISNLLPYVRHVMLFMIPCRRRLASVLFFWVLDYIDGG